MAKLIFLEGVSGVGKSTMAKKLCEHLRSADKNIKTYVEFDYTNPIDFYCVAYYAAREYETLCVKYPQYERAIRANTVYTENARLIHYFDRDTPLFEKPLLSELMEREFCYNPQNPVSFEDYSKAYVAVWKNFVDSLSDDVDFIIFDGSLLHHPINDMIRNYGAAKEQALAHIQKLLGSLGKTEYKIYYLQTENIASQLQTAYHDRGQEQTDDSAIAFWEKRYTYDSFVLANIDSDYCIFDVRNKWNDVEKKIVKELLYADMES